MTTEVSATEQTAEVVVEEIKETENVVNDGEEGSSQSKDLEGKKEEEKVKEDLGIAKQSATESKETPESEKRDAVAKDVKRDAVAKDVKKEEDLQSSNSEILASATEEKGERTEQESVTQAVEQAVEVQEKELKDHLDVATIPEPPTEIEKSAEDSEQPSVKVSEAEEAKEPAISAMPEEENPKKLEVAKGQVVSAVSEEENPQESEVAEDSVISEDSAISAVVEEENPKESQVEEPAISAVSEEERPKVSEAVEEPVTEPANSEAVSEEHKLSEADKPTEETTVAFSATETEDKFEPTIAPTATEPKINTITTPDDSGTAEISQVETISIEEHETLKEEPLITDSSNEEIFNKLPEVPVAENSDPLSVEALPLNELKEVGDEILLSQEVPDVSEKTDTNQISSRGVEESVTEENVSVGTDSIPVTEIIEGLLKPVDKVEEQIQEKVVKEPTLSGTTQTDNATEVSQATSVGSGGVEKVNENMDETSGAVVDTSESLDAATEVSQVAGEKASGGIEVAEEKNVSVEGDNTTLVQMSRDLDVVGEGKDKDTTTDNLEDSEGKKGETEKAAERNTVESAKDGADITKEVTAKPPQRQSNSIFSKVKQSIVKVKKAIIGKSPNSKTTTPEGNDDIKVK